MHAAVVRNKTIIFSTQRLYRKNNVVAGKRILKVTRKYGNWGRCRKLSLWNCNLLGFLGIFVHNQEDVHMIEAVIFGRDVDNFLIVSTLSSTTIPCMMTYGIDGQVPTRSRPESWNLPSLQVLILSSQWKNMLIAAEKRSVWTWHHQSLGS